MEIIKKYVLLFLFLYLTNALDTKKQNQTTPTIESKSIPDIISFIEDATEGKASSYNKNSTLQKIDLTKKSNKSKITLNASPEHDFMKSIYLPIDLLLKHPKINSLEHSIDDVNSSTPSTKETVLTYFKPKIDFCEENIDVIDNSITALYNTLKRKQPKQTLKKLEDVKFYEECVDMKPEHLEAPEIHLRNAVPNLDNSYFQMNDSQNNKETLAQKTNTSDATIEILIKLDPSISNAVSRPNSSIIIHNSSYQEIIQPRWSYNPVPPYRYPFHWSYRPYSYRQYNPSNIYKSTYDRPYCVYRRYNPYESYTSQYPGYVNLPDAVCKTWNNMDINVINPKDVKFNYEGNSDDSDLNRVSDCVYDYNVNEIEDEDTT